MRRNLWIVGAAGAAALTIGALVAFVVLPLRQDAGIGAAYAAKQVCSCLHVEERSLASCRGDLPSTLRSFSIAAHDERGEVRAALFPLASAVAVVEEGFGCRLK